jgi:hypothetical protein
VLTGIVKGRQRRQENSNSKERIVPTSRAIKGRQRRQWEKELKKRLATMATRGGRATKAALKEDDNANGYRNSNSAYRRRERQWKQEFKDNRNYSIYSNSSDSRRNGIGRGANIVGTRANLCAVIAGMGAN